MKDRDLLSQSTDHNSEGCFDLWVFLSMHSCTKQIIKPHISQNVPHYCDHVLHYVILNFARDPLIRTPLGLSAKCQIIEVSSSQGLLIYDCVAYH